MGKSTVVFLCALGCVSFAKTKSEQGGGNVTCKASPELVEKGENATLTCQFPYDISQIPTVWLTVKHYPNSEKEQADDLVECMKYKSSELKCSVSKEGYIMDGKVKTSLKLNITNVSAQHSGRFLCQMVSPEGERPELTTCPLLVLGSGNVTCKASPELVEKGGNATLTCQFPYDISQMPTVWLTVKHYPNSEKEKADDLVECMKYKSSELKCSVSKEDYIMDDKVKTSLKLNITNVSAQHSGRFLCQMVSPEGERPELTTCPLLVLGSGNVTCKASPELVEKGGNATLTCQFPYDISQMPTVWLTVKHYPNSEEEQADDLVDCTKHKSSELECIVSKEGYIMDGKVKTGLKLIIPNVSAQHSGRFLCQMVPPEGEIPEPIMCPLIVLERDADKKTISAMTIPLVVLMVVVVAALGIAAVILWIKYGQNRCASSPAAEASVTIEEVVDLESLGLSTYRDANSGRGYEQSTRKEGDKENGLLSEVDKYRMDSRRAIVEPTEEVPLLDDKKLSEEDDSPAHSPGDISKTEVQEGTDGAEGGEEVIVDLNAARSEGSSQEGSVAREAQKASAKEEGQEEKRDVDLTAARNEGTEGNVSRLRELFETNSKQDYNGGNRMPPGGSPSED